MNKILLNKSYPKVSKNPLHENAMIGSSAEHHSSVCWSGETPKAMKWCRAFDQ